MDLVGKIVKKSFQGFGVFTGVIESYDSSSGFFKILYEDGDSEDMEFEEVDSLLRGTGDESLPDQIEKKRPGRKPKKRRRGEGKQEMRGSGDSGNSGDTQMNDCGFGEIQVKIDSFHEGFEEKSLEKNCCFHVDLNENGSFKAADGTLKEDAGFEETQMKDDGLEANQINDGSFHGGVFESSVKENGCFDVNLKGNDSFNAGEETRKKDDVFGADSKGNPSFDVLEDTQSNDSLRIFEETEMKGVGGDGNLKGSALLPAVEDVEMVANGLGEHSKQNAEEIWKADCIVDTDLKKVDGSSRAIEDTPKKDSGFDVGFVENQPNGTGFGTPDNEDIGCNKRRKLSENLKSTPESALRRSARRTSAVLISSSNPVSGTDKLPDAVNAVSEEKSVDHSKEFEEHSGFPPKLVLPPSSNNLDINGLPILDLFSVYACLRSFSTILFLSPFGLEAFVAALKCSFANSLIDSIHLSILQSLKLHLKLLSDEPSEPASDCLRNLNWELLDIITWPVYLVEYLLIFGSGLKSGFELSRLKLLNGEYYKQSPLVKLEILRCLCDDVIEVEAIRSELNRRMLVSELDPDLDRVPNIENYKKKNDPADDLGIAVSTQEVEDEGDDRNSDECCLCKMDGSLICCDGCPAAYHSRCVGVAQDNLPEGDWYCPECVMEKQDGWMKSSKPIRGAELLGIDCCGRLYFGCCGYLVVSDSCDTEASYYYYDRKDLNTVIELFKSSDVSYSGIIHAISMHWGISGDSTQADHFDHEIHTISTDSDMDNPTCPTHLSSLPLPLLKQDEVKGEADEEMKPKEYSVTPEDCDLQSCKSFSSFNSATVKHPMEIRSTSASSVKTAEISQAFTQIQTSQKTGADCSTKSISVASCESALPENINFTKEGSALNTDLYSVQEKRIGSPVHARKSLVRNLMKTGSSQIDVEYNCYINHYDFGQRASVVAEELTRKASDKITQDSKKSAEDMILAQLKVISKKSIKFCWSNIQRLSIDVQKEKCGWCFSCKTSSDRDCLFNTTDKKVSEDSKIGTVGLRSKRNRKSHLTSVIYHILSIEERLHGLLSGPWENPHHSKQWRKSLLKASEVAAVKPLLLILESNLRRIALLAEWSKQVDSSVKVGSSSHVFTSSVHVSSKNAGGKKHGRKNIVDGEFNSLSHASTTSGIHWWRGGRLSRQVFHWKMLPQSLASKGGRRAGCQKIPGIFYPDASECAKRSKYIVWRAAVEMLTSVPQLACQVRDLDSNIRWEDLARTHLFRAKESNKLSRALNKVTVRRKGIEGTHVKYLLDFGKRKTIPEIVIKHGVMLEESSSGRKKYWLDESYVPLNLLKAFEEKKLAKRIKKTKFGLLYEDGGKLRKPSRQKGLSHLLSKGDKYENYQCGHCNKDVLVREAVQCQLCKGFFHKRHIKVSKGTITAKCTHACYRCQDKKVKKHAKIKTEGRKVRSVKGKISTERRSKRLLKKVKFVPVKTKKLGGRKKSNKHVGRKKSNQSQSKREVSKKSTDDISWHKGQRTHAYHAYWLNGLRWTRIPNDGRVMHFREMRVMISQPSEDTFMQPVCCLCHEGYDSGLIYVGCENCEEWFHGEAFGLTAKSINSLIGFKCHKCRMRNIPMCPYSKDAAFTAAQLCEEKNYGTGPECVNDPSVDDKLPSETYERPTFLPDEQGLIVPGHREDVISDSNRTLMLEVEECTSKAEEHITFPSHERAEEVNLVCPYSKDEVVNGAGTECVKDPSVNGKHSSVLHERLRFPSNKVCPGLFHIDESVKKEQRADATPDSNQALMLEQCSSKAEKGHSSYDFPELDEAVNPLQKKQRVDVPSDSSQALMLEQCSPKAEKVYSLCESHELAEPVNPACPCSKGEAVGRFCKEKNNEAVTECVKDLLFVDDKLPNKAYERQQFPSIEAFPVLCHSDDSHESMQGQRTDAILDSNQDFLLEQHGSE